VLYAMAQLSRAGASMITETFWLPIGFWWRFCVWAAARCWLYCVIRRPRHFKFLFPLASLLVMNPLWAQDVRSSGSLHQADYDGSRAPTVQPALERTRVLVETIRSASYPELTATRIELRPFQKASDFFRVRPRIPDFFARKNLRYIMQINPRVYELQASENGIEAIIAHELGHVAYLQERNRLKHLALIRLLSRSFVSNFERRTDLEAISRGYGEGLKVYRQWLYQHIPQKDLAEKRRDYFSPEEIDSILLRVNQCPPLLDSWVEKPPRNLQDIQLPASCQSRP
jgi:hypothetical protein